VLEQPLLAVSGVASGVCLLPVTSALLGSEGGAFSAGGALPPWRMTLSVGSLPWLSVPPGSPRVAGGQTPGLSVEPVQPSPLPVLPLLPPPPLLPGFSTFGG
jgi:hypothetical protein